MGKKAKEHRKKVAARNAKISQKKSAMQKAFDMLIQQQLDKMKAEDVKVESAGQEVNFEVVEDKVIEHAFKFTPNEEESAKINKEFEEEPQIEE
jgi:predicted metal-dependent peptidase